MSNPIVVSGLDEATCRRLLGDRAWASASPRWRAPARVLAKGAAELETALLYWLFRSPGHTLLDAPAAVSTNVLLDEWAQRNRAALNLRRDLGARLVLLDVDALGADALLVLLKAPTSADDDMATTLDALLPHLSPRANEVHRSLDAAAWPPRGELVREPDEAGLVRLVDVLRQGRDDSEAGARADAAERRGEQLAKDLVNEQHAYRTQRAELDATREERDRLQVQLHQVQEEIEQYYVDGLRLQEQVQGLQASLAHRQDQNTVADAALATQSERARVLEAERAAADEEIRALRMQLRYMQDELGAATNARFLPGPVAPSLWERAKSKARRSVGRLRGSPGNDGASARTADLAQLRGSRWFDRQWYLERYPDVAAAGLDPAEHYLDFGANEKRDPGPDFSTAYYLDANADVAASGLNPLLHFVRHGLGEGRRPRKP